MGVGLQRSLPADYYVGRDLWERERERIFFREWFCVGRTEEVPDPGSYVVRDVAGESILIVRTRAGELRAHYNLCRHRGCRLVLPDLGADRSSEHDHRGHFAGAIRCPYHSWTYSLEGELRGAPFLNDADGFVKESLGLHTVAVDTWGGFVFVHLTPEEPEAQGHTLLTQLGAIPGRLARYPLAALRSGGRIDYDVAANWKVVLENYNECYHCAGVHPELCRVVPAFRRGGTGLDWDEGIPHRDGAYTFTATGTSNREPFSSLDARERQRHKGELLYPNLMLSLSADHVAAFTLWPRGPAATRISCTFLFDENETQVVGFDPSDAVEFWDLVNRQDWRVCEGVQQGMSSRAFTTGYFAPMEDPSLDIRRYVAERLGVPAES